MLFGTDNVSRGGSDILPDSPCQRNAEPDIPWASSVTTLSQSGSSHSHIAHMFGSDPKQETVPKHPLVAGSVCSPFEVAAKQTAPEHIPTLSSDPKQGTVQEHSSAAASVRSPFEAVAKPMAPEHLPNAKPVRSPFDITPRARLHQPASDAHAQEKLQSTFALARKADDSP